VENTPIGTVSYIKNIYPSLTGSLQKIALYIIDKPNIVIESTVQALSGEIGVSDTSVIRFCKELGFSGYADFKLKFAQDFGGGKSYVPDVISKNDSPWDVISTILRNEYEDIKFTLQMTDKNNMLKATAMLHAARRIGFFGIGSSGIVACDAKEHFLLLGKAAQYEPDGTAQVLLVNSLHKEDLAFAISLTGQTRIPLKVLEIAKRNGVPSICLTQNPQSEMSKYADVTLLAYKKSRASEDLATSSRIIFSAILDALAVACSTCDWDKYTGNISSARNSMRELE